MESLFMIYFTPSKNVPVVTHIYTPGWREALLVKDGHLQPSSTCP